MDPCTHNDVSPADTTTGSTMTNGTQLSGPLAGGMNIQIGEASDDAAVLVNSILNRRVDNCPNHEPNCPRCGVR